MSTFQIVLIIIAVALTMLGAIAYMFSIYTRKIRESSEGALLAWLQDMKVSVDRNSDILQKQLTDQRDNLDKNLKGQRESIVEQTRLIWQKLDNANEVIRSIQTHLGGLQEFQKDMKDLSNVLKSPKLRGNLGEEMLYEILANNLPSELYSKQYKFKDGAICDAVIHTEHGLLPIDSKFPMENLTAQIKIQNEIDRDKLQKAFAADVKKRVEEVASKYILPNEGTMHQAIMYVPSESVFYEIITTMPTVEVFARSKNVLLASPNTLCYVLRIILIAYRQKVLQTHTHEILKAISGIRIDAQKMTEDIDVLAKHISNSYKSVDGFKSKYDKFVGKLSSLEEIEKPLVAEAVEAVLDEKEIL